MSFSLLNFSLDLAVLAVMVAFVLPQKPLQVLLIAFIYIFSYVLPMGFIQNGFRVPPVSSGSSDIPSAPLGQNGVADTLRAAQIIEGVSQTLGQTMGENPSASALSEVKGTGTNSKSVPSSRSQLVSPLSRYLHLLASPVSTKTQRYGRDLSAASAEMVERLWFYARMCVLFALIPFFVADPKVTLGIGSLIALPVPYLCVFGIWLWRLAFPSSGALGQSNEIPPSVLLACIAMAVVIVSLAGYAWWVPRSQRTDVFVPDPELYRVKLMGQWFDFVIEGTTLRLQPGNIELDLSRASSPPENPRRFQFLSGTEIEFAKRAKENALTPDQES
jgi:hypothetical protein